MLSPKTRKAILAGSVSLMAALAAVLLLLPEHVPKDPPAPSVKAADPPKDGAPLGRRLP